MMTQAPVQNHADLNVHGLSDLILNLHRAGRDAIYEKFQSRALQQISEVIPFDSAWWGIASTEPQEIHQLHLHNCDESILAEYPSYMERDIFRAALIANPGVTINLVDLTTRTRFVKTELYRKFCKPYGIEWSLGTLHIEPLLFLSEFLTVWRHSPTQPFRETERYAMELLMPHLIEAHRSVRLRNVVSDASARDRGWAVADERGFLRDATPEFMRALREYRPDWKGGLLPGVLLESVQQATSCRMAHLKLNVTCKGPFRYLKIQAENALDSLSLREREIVLRYARGATYAAIAAALELSPHTVRNHLARSYHKLSVNNKSELVRRVVYLDTGLSQR